MTHDRIAELEDICDSLEKHSEALMQMNIRKGAIIAEMLEAFKLIVEVGDRAAIEIARDAIARATGGRA